MESEVEQCGSGGETEEVASRGEDKHLLVVDVHLEIAHQLHGAWLGVLEEVADFVHPGVKHLLALDALVAPVGGEAFLGHEVHAASAYLYLDPFPLGTCHGDVERLVAVAFRHRDPVFHARGVGLVHVGDHGVGQPAVVFLLLGRSVDYDAYGEEVIYVVDVVFLLLDFVPDWENRLGASLDFKVEPHGEELLPEGGDESRYVCVAFCLALVELAGDVGVGLPVGVFQRHVFQLGFYGI